MLERGYLRLGTIRGSPIRIHWTMPVGALVFGGFQLVPVFWVGFFVLLLVHELGHAALVRRFGHRVLSVDITGFGGMCRWSGMATPRQRGAIAWGGVAAQALVLVLALVALLLFGLPATGFGAALVSVFVWTNLWLIGLNLLPFPPLDGAEAWPLVGKLLGGGRSSSRRRRGGGGSLRQSSRRRPGESWRW